MIVDRASLESCVVAKAITDIVLSFKRCKTSDLQAIPILQIEMPHCQKKKI